MHKAHLSKQRAHDYILETMTSSDVSRPVVFITGASAGIGAAAVGIFAAAGYDVVFGARRFDRLEKTRAALAPLFPNAKLIPVTCDVNSDASVQAAFEQVRSAYGRLDVLVNNAGYGMYGSVEATSLQAYRDNMETNFIGVIRCTQAALPLLRAAATTSKRRWGAAIVMVSSVVGRRAIPGLSGYSASKFALEALSESLRVELHDERISVSVINPGVTQTEFVSAAHGQRPKSFLSPNNGMTPEAVARVILQAVRKPKRNRYLTLAGKAGVLGEWLCPSVVDRVLVSSWRKARGEKTAAPATPAE